MSISTNTIDKIIEQQVESGSCDSATEAQQELIAKLIEKDIDERIAKGRADIEAGRIRVLNEENNARFLQQLEEKLIAKSNTHGKISGH